MKSPRPRPRRSSSSDKVISINSDGDSRGSNSAYEEFSLDEPPPPDPRTSPPAPATPGNGNGGNGDLDCPSCGAINPGSNRHCQECGARLRQGPLPTAPRPAVQATAGVRAALAISGLLLGVIHIALFFNIFTGDDPIADPSTTTTSTTLAAPTNPEQIEILEENCNPEGIGGLICANLTNGQFGQGNEYQVNWQDVEDVVTITLSFREPMAITSIEWTNIDDLTRFRQNFRASALEISAQDSVTPVVAQLNDEPGTQIIDFSSLSTTQLVIEVVDAHLAEVVEDNSFDELAIDEIVVVGRPVVGTGNTTGTTAPADTGSTSTTAG
ncbi:MAG TPA: zinc ribbon domain-containing protein [Acidimicrobiia bacterium]